MIKKIIYVVILIAVIGAGYFSFKLLSGRQTQPSNQIQSGLLPDSSISSTLPAHSPSENTYPTTPMITIGTSQGIVEVKNFYNSIVDTEEGLLILADRDDYEIAYDRSNSSFMVALRSDAPKARKAGETELLNILGIGQPDACKLNVQVFLNPSVQFAASLGKPRQGREGNQNLSFCLNKL